VGKEDADPSDVLAKTWKVLAWAGGVAAAIVAFLGNLARVNFSGATHEIHLPLWVVIAFVVALVVVAAFVVTLMCVLTKWVRNNVSYWRGEARNLGGIVSQLEDLAYYDAITGLPNANQLDRELSRPHNDRCLILLDLLDFGSVNKQHGHWKGDEYLRKFSSMISSDSRRNESIYKQRPMEENSATLASALGSDTGALKAFRRNDGGDEFYIVLRGTVIEALGYLNRLFSRRNAFDDMAKGVLGAPHPFGFRAGVAALGINEDFESATQRVSDCLRSTMATGSESPRPPLVDWARIQGDDRTPAGYEDEKFPAGSMPRNILATARMNFATVSCKIDDVQPGGVVAVDRGAGGERLYKVVSKERKSEGGKTIYVITFEDGSGGTFVKDYPAGDVVIGSIRAG
jgi:Diguanylate cyclase, GGDEF domain